MTFLDLFAGVGGARRGMELAGHQCIGFCEFDKYAVASYTSMHLITEEQRKHLETLTLKQRQKEILKDEYKNGEWYAKDITEVTGESTPKADCWCFGAPCFVAGTLITTHRGRIPIEDICIGDLVLTHKSRFKPVTEKMINYHDDIYDLKVQGALNIQVTGNHRFYVRYKNKVWNNVNKNYDNIFTEPEWKSVQDFNGDEFILMPHNKNNSNSMNLTDQECFLLGRYIADGYLQEYERKERNTLARRVVFCIGNGKEEYFKIKTTNYKFTIDDSTKNCKKYISLDKRLFGLCKECGKGAINKHIPFFVMNLPKDKLRIFFDGYLSGDAYYNKEKDFYTMSSISKELILQLSELVIKTFNTPTTIYFQKTNDTHIIENRIVNQHDVYTLKFSKTTKKQNNAKYIDDELWTPIKSVKLKTREKNIVYNLEVEDDHSYTAGGLAAHNCQDFSIAGKRAGLKGNRSSLIFEVFRILGEIEEENRPEWLLYENVKGMFSSNKGFDYLAILLAMDELGYDVEWQLFNSKYYVPQNRERVYTLGHLRRKGSAKVFPICPTDRENSVQPSINNKMFGIDYNVGGEERPIANAIKARYDAGVTNFKQDGTAVAVPIGIIDPQGRIDKEVNPQDISPTLRAQSHGNQPEVVSQIIKAAKYPSGNERSDILSVDGICKCLSATDYKQPVSIVIPVLTPDRAEKRQNGRRFKENGEPAFTLTAQDKHGVAIKITEATKQGYAEAHEGDSINLSVPGSKTRRGRVGHKVAQTLDTSCSQGIIVAIEGEEPENEHPGVYVQLYDDCTVYAVWYEKYQCYIAIRKLTPKECFRLQGWSDDYFEKAEFVNSDSQLYKQAGNGITVPVVEVIGKALNEVKLK